MQELIRNLETTPGPLRQLDMAIHIALKVPKDASGKPVYIPGLHSTPEYTASIDAALTLVPRGWVWTAARQYGHEGKMPYFADCASPAWIAGTDGCLEQGEAFANTPAIALCIAALKAYIASQQ